MPTILSLRCLAVWPLATLALFAGGGSSKPASGPSRQDSTTHLQPVLPTAEEPSGRTTQRAAPARGRNRARVAPEPAATTPARAGAGATAPAGTAKPGAGAGAGATAPARSGKPDAGAGATVPIGTAPVGSGAGASAPARAATAGAGAGATAPIGSSPAGAMTTLVQSFSLDPQDALDEDPPLLDLGQVAPGLPGAQPIGYTNNHGTGVLLVPVGAPGGPRQTVYLMERTHPGLYQTLQPSGYPVAAGASVRLYPHPEAEGLLCLVMDDSGRLLERIPPEPESPQAPPCTARGAAPDA